MKIPGMTVAGLPLIASVLVGFTLMVPSDHQAPTSTPIHRGVEGDDGSLGGPVYNQQHQTKPIYVFRSQGSRG